MFYGHHGPEAFARGGAFALVFVAGWTVMVVAMMLPTSLTLVILFRTLTRQRQDRARLVALLIVGYLGVWTLFGGVVYFGGLIVQHIARESSWLEANAWILSAGIVTLAGLYQFTPLKYKCLDKCRSPLSFIVEHWRGNHERSRAFRLGAHHGLFCVGCCWSLMLLMFVVGAGSLGWMLVLGAVMAVEKNVPRGRKIGPMLGAVLLGSGLVLGAMPALQSFGGTPARIALASTDEHGPAGTATFADTAGGVEVELDVRGLPDPGATYLAHVHPGSCAGEPAGGNAAGHAHNRQGGTEGHAHGHHHGNAGGSAGEIEQPLTPLVSDSGGNGSSVTIIEGTTVARLFSGSPEFYVNVLTEASDSEGLPGAIVCADLRDSG